MTTANHQYGRDYRVKIDDGTGVMVPIAGESGWNKKTASDKVDLSSKDDDGIKAQGFGLREITISVSGKAKLPDAGISRVQAVQASSPPEVRMQLVKGATVVYDGLVGIGNWSLDGQANGAVGWSFDAAAVAGPTIDTLDAVA